MPKTNQPPASPNWLKLPNTPSPQAGVDEAGRGALAGDVIAAAVILHPQTTINGLNDSKKLTPARREACLAEIIQQCVCFAIGRASPREIDRLNILQASLLAMQRAVEQLNPGPAFVLVDGNALPDWPYPARAIPRGDARIQTIAAASIIAKVTRDREMIALDQKYPDYGFAQHKGYPTPQHRQALATQGPTPHHRQSFAPVTQALALRGEARSAQPTRSNAS